MTRLTSAQQTLIAPYVSNLEDDVFAVSGLPEEVIAVLFAYYSRSRDDLRTSLARLLADQELAVDTEAPRKFGLAVDKARAFHEKWVVGYGHASVAEHAIVHLALENVSILASKAIEDMRLSSFTEKSTRYVVFTEGSFYTPGELPLEFQTDYVESCHQLFRTYLRLVPAVTSKLESKYPRPDSQSQTEYAAIIRARALDLVRGLLPAGTITNLGLTANARTLAAGISKLAVSRIAEVRDLSAAMRSAGQTVVPTLLRHSQPSEYLDNLSAHSRYVADSLVAKAQSRSDGSNEFEELIRDSRAKNPVRFVRHDEIASIPIAVALACDGEAPLPMAEEMLGLFDLLVQSEDIAGYSEQSMPKTDVRVGVAVVRDALHGRGSHDQVPRAFEHAHMTFEMDLDYGAYRDLARHRMLTPAHRMLTCNLGYDVPEGLSAMGLADDYRNALDEAAAVWRKLQSYDPVTAQYAVPLGYKTRVLWTLNLREAIHVIELRSSKQGHASYRRIAQKLYEHIVRLYPWLHDLIRVDLNEYDDAR
ncbi:FAD-dependent thymidylate synthase [Candidatus Dependentiae bacterium]|nr:MAG: FAD-dependent thymidylate synthase [Candidatus Dependentiae bacterium]